MESTKLLPDLDNPEEYTLIPNVAILDEDIEDDPDFEWLTPDLLPKIVSNTNRKVDEGELVLINIGHNDNDLAEIDQPPIVGFAKNLQMGTHAGRNAILADMYIKAENWDLAMTFPRRSVELFLNQEYIDVVSLLRRKPARNLGLITCKSEGGKTKYCKSIGDSMDFTDDELTALVEKLAPLLQAKFSLSDDEEKTETTEDEDKKDNDYSAATDTNSPNVEPLKNEADDDEEKKKDDDKETLRLRSDQEAIHLSQANAEIVRLRSDLAKSQAEVVKLKSANTRVAREGTLKHLLAEGYQFDLPAELEDSVSLSDAQFTKHVDRVRKHYRRLPIGKGFIQTQEPGEDEGGYHLSAKDKAEHDAVIAYAVKHRIKNFATAKAQMKKESK